MALRAAASQDLLQQLHAQLKALTVDKLKKVLKKSGLPVTGTKATLIERISYELNKSSQSNDMNRFTGIRQSIQNPDNPLPPTYAFSATPGASNSYKASNTGGSHGSNIAAGRFTHQSGSSTETSTLKFKQSPFHVILETIGNRKQLDPRESTRDSLEFSFRLRSDLADQMRRDRKVKLLVFSGTDDAFRGPSDITFPTNFEVIVNGSELRTNFKGLKNKPGTTRPADITQLINQSGAQDNYMRVSWAVTTRKYHLILYLARQQTPEELLQKLKVSKHISKVSVINEMSRPADDNDIVAMSSRMSLKCPLSTMRIETPCRSRVCMHNQCFDALSFLQLQEQAPQWSCPVCNKHVPFDILQIDEYVDEVLRCTSRSVEQVSVEPGGRWTLVRDDADQVQSPPRIPKREHTGTSDDIIEILDASPTVAPRSLPVVPSKLSNAPIRAPQDQSTIATSHSTMSKRSATEVIDLTADSDDEDQLIKPPTKKQQIDGPDNIDWNGSYHRSAQNSTEHHSGFSFSMPRQTQLPHTSNFGS